MRTPIEELEPGERMLLIKVIIQAIEDITMEYPVAYEEDRGYSYSKAEAKRWLRTFGAEILNKINVPRLCILEGLKHPEKLWIYFKELERREGLLLDK